MPSRQEEGVKPASALGDLSRLGAGNPTLNHRAPIRKRSMVRFQPATPHPPRERRDAFNSAVQLSYGGNRAGRGRANGSPPARDETAGNGY